MSSSYDVIVIGVGGMGSAAAFHLARRGARVLGLERFDVPHAMGSSHGVNRIIRRTYYEHPDYVPLLGRAYELWRDLERTVGHRVLHVTGAIDAGPERSETFRGSLASCLRYGLPHEVLAPAEVARRFPAYRLPPGAMAVFQPDGGFVASEGAIVAHVLGARAAGADIRARERVLSWRAEDGRVVVTSERATYEAERLVLSAGPWMLDLVPALRGFAVPERQVLGWFQPIRPALFAPERFPVFNLTVEEATSTDFRSSASPASSSAAITTSARGRRPTAATGSPGRRMRRCCAPAPSAISRTAPARSEPQDLPVHQHARRAFPGRRSSDHPEVLLLSPCSGHGYKFCPVIGEIAADLVLDGCTRHDIGLVPPRPSPGSRSMRERRQGDVQEQRRPREAARGASTTRSASAS
jgi:sarcosine oxidase